MPVLLVLGVCWHERVDVAATRGPRGRRQHRRRRHRSRTVRGSRGPMAV